MLNSSFVSQTGVRELCRTGSTCLLQRGETNVSQRGEVKTQALVNLSDLALDKLLFTKALYFLTSEMIRPLRLSIDLLNGLKFVISEGTSIDPLC